MSPSTRIPTLALSFALSTLLACGVGEIGGSGPGPGDNGSGGGGAGPDAGAAPGTPDAEPAPDAAPPDYAMLVGPTDAALSLGETVELTVDLTSERHDGPVTLAVAGAPASWNITFAPSDTIDLTYDGAATATILVEVPSNGEALSSALQITATAAPGERIASVPVTVANELTISIGDGTADGQHNFPPAAEIRLGATVNIQNADGSVHRIHSDNGNAGFPHQDGDLDPGTAYSFTINRSGQFDYYCHEHNVGAGVGSIVVTE